MRVMGGLGDDTKVKYDVVDGIHAVSDINPIHLPHVWSPVCPNEDDGCTLNLTTVTEQVYSSLIPSTPAILTRVRPNCG